MICQDSPYLSLSQPHGCSSTAVGERGPQLVQLFLAVDPDLQRDRLGEVEMRTPVDSDERLPVEFELHDQRHVLRGR